MMKKGILLTILLLLFTCTTVKAESTREKVKVGWFEHPNYQETLEDGKKYGYSYEYYQVISKYIGISYEFIDVSFDEEDDNYWHTLLDNGTIDVIGCMSYDERIAEEYTLSTLQQGSETAAIFTIESKLYNLEDVKNKRIGVKAGPHKRALDDYLEMNSISATIVEYSSYDELYAGLEKKEVDFGASQGVTGVKGIKCIAYYNPSFFYFCFNKDNKEIIDAFNEAMQIIKQNSFYYNEDLYSKYVETGEKEFVLTDEEKEYVRQFNENNEYLNVYFIRNNYPSSFSKGGNHVGYMVDVCDRIEELTGIDMRKTYDSNDIDMIAFIEDNFIKADEEGYHLSKKLLSVPLVVVGNVNGSKMAVPKYITNGYRFDTLGYEVEKMENVDDCFIALKKGKVDGVVCAQYTADYYKAMRSYSSFPSTTLLGQNFDACMAIKKDKDEVLTGIIMKAINYIADVEIDEIVIDTVTVIYTNAFIAFINELEWYVILIVAIILVTIIIAIALLTISFIARSKKMAKILNYDKLTGLYSYTGFCKELEKTIKKKNPGDNKYYVVIAKVNYLDIYTEINGEMMTDRLSTIIAKELKNVINDAEFSSRFANNSFCMLLIEHDVEKLQTRISNWSIGQSLGVTMKYGIYEVNDDNENARSMCSKALQIIAQKEENLYTTICVYDLDKRAKRKEELELVSDFREAIDRGEFVAYYQPKYDVFTEKIVGAEALVRWKRDDDIIPPVKFIKLFEENNLIEELDFCIFAQACDTINMMKAKGIKPIPIAVNFSRVHIYNMLFVQTLVEIADSKGVDHTLLEIELTETTFCVELAIIDNVIKELHEASFLISIDDFGSGYSSLNMLKDINADVLKIDMNFLSNFNKEEKSAIIVNSIIRMAKWLGMVTVAEGVDDVEQVEYLKSVGCDYIQGYYFAKPLTIDDFFSKMDEGIQYVYDKYFTVEAKEINELLGGNYLITKFLNSIDIACAIYEYFDDKLEIVRVNIAYEKTLKTNVKYDLDHIDAFNYVHQDDVKLLRDALDVLIKTNVAREVEFRRLIKNYEDEEYCYVRGTAFLFSGDNKRKFVCLAFTDISREEEYRHKYANTEKYNEQLASLLRLIVEKHYEYIVLIDVETTKYILYGNAENMQTEAETGLFDEGTMASANRYIKEDMREKFFENAKFETVMKHMKKDGAYSYRFEIYKGDHLYERRFEFHYLNKEKDVIILFATIKDLE